MKLTPDQLRQNAAAMLAFADGKPVQTRSVHYPNQSWTTLTRIEPSWDFGINEYRPAPWTLPAPPAGKQWHRTDWTEEMLPEGFRPLLDGETPIISEDEVLDGGIWREAINDHSRGKSSFFTRTRRPLPAEPVTRPWSKPEDVPGPVCWLRVEGHIGRRPTLILEILDAGVIIISNLGNSSPTQISWEKLAEWQHSTDRKTWHPCTVTQ